MLCKLTPVYTLDHKEADFLKSVEISVLIISNKLHLSMILK